MDVSEPDPKQAVHTAANGDVFNDADAAFASDLVQHHALSLTLVDLTRGRSVSPELEALEELDGPEFERRWLELMVAHHEGAIEIAEEETDAGRFSPALDLAAAVVTTQQNQVERMKSLLGG